MCLYSVTRLPKKSKKKIKIYKVVIPDSDGYLSIFRLFKLSAGNITRENLRLKHIFKYMGTKVVESGVIHSWRTLKLAENCLSANRGFSDSYRIVEGYIPQGTLYYEGIFGDIASEKIYLY